MAVTGSETYTTTYTYDKNNRLTQENKKVGGTTTTTVYIYDDNGNLLQKSNPSGAEQNYYNGFNQLTQTRVGNTVAEYTYNASGIRTSKQVGTSTTYYLLDGGDVVAEYTDGALTASYLRGINLLSRVTTDGTEYYLHNAHGDVVALTNTSGTVTKRYDYDAFGNEENPSSSDTNPFRYCGEYFDKETKTYYLRARYYDPAIGRFTQQDTHWSPANAIYGDNPRKINERQDALGLNTYAYAPEISAIMQSGNLYVYCVNNPVQYSDVSGNFILSTAALLAIGGFALFGTIGGLIGNHMANENGATGWEKAGYITGGALFLGGAGALCGYMVAPAVVSATGIGGLTVTSAGINIVYSDWQQAEQALRDMIGSVTSYTDRVFKTPLGNRVADAYNATPRLIAEAKYGYVNLTDFVQKQIAKDAYLLQKGSVDFVEWHFYLSQETGQGGASAQLLEELLNHGFRVFFHF